MDRFELEQSILECWGILEDIDLAAEKAIENEKQLVCNDNWCEDEKDKISNILLGIKSLYELKFQKTWSQFEGLVKDGQL